MNIEQRLNRLERYNKILVGCLSLVVVGFIFGQAKPKGDEAKALDVLTVDKLYVKQLLTVGEKHSRLRIYNSSTGTSLSMWNSSKIPLISMSITGDGKSSLSFASPDSLRGLVSIGTLRRERQGPLYGFLNILADEYSGIAARITAEENGGKLALRNKTKEEVVTLQTDEYGLGEVGAWDRKGKGRTLSPRP